ncbi:RDD family protein [Sporosarcina sp. GW1-11]|uniref:RDD family protein n=1 Tax=Sporosarcina sp. GW1-11 TaxID=2899126 RepID=UPI00294EBE0B|nr:RDD family protein [Sporosarcina sp. GW1-11]MDV6377536.1 RDD family protein [Sporosarcina sp. GW1-11]
MTNESINMQTSHFEPKYAGFWIRFWAFIIDLFVVSAISGIFIKPIFRLMDVAITKPSFLLYSPYKVAALVLLILYFLLMTKLVGQTIGKMIMGIRVVKMNGQKLTWSSVVFREGFGRFISQTLWIPYVLVLFMPQKMALHDVFADTVVVHERLFERKDVQMITSTEGHQLHEDPTI